MPVEELELTQELAPLVLAVERGDNVAAAQALRSLSARIGALLAPEWASICAAALESGRYERIAEAFAREQIAGPNGHFLLVGPYSLRAAPHDVVAPALVFGRLLAHTTLVGIDAEIEAIQHAAIREPIVPVVPMHTIVRAGNLRNVSFFVPDGWCWKQRALGPALVDVENLRRGFAVAGPRCVRTVFEPETADLLLGLMTREGEDVHFRPYQIHDTGHSAGLGLAHKIRDELLPSCWHRGVEEWRADGIGFEVAMRRLGAADVAGDLALNMCVRFGWDIPLAEDGVDRSDEHALTSLIILDRMLQEGLLQIHDRRLKLTHVSHEGLVDAFEPHRQEAIALTRRELSLTDPGAVVRMYGSISVHRASESILEGMIRQPCIGIYREAAAS